ncbi:MAG: TldD/PmbA family protein, partial [Nitriliruptoraceae bacterium]
MTSDPITGQAQQQPSDTSVLEALAERTVALVHERDARDEATIEANVSVSRSRHGLTRFANSFIHQHVGEDTIEVSLTLAVDGRPTSTSTTATDDGSLEQLVDGAIASARLQPLDPHWPGATPPADITDHGRVDAATAAASPDERAGLVRDFVAAGDGLRAAGYCDTELSQAAFASTAGHRISGATTRATIDGIHQTTSSAGSAHGTSIRLAELDADRAGHTAADLARRSQDAIDLDPGEYEVVLGPEAVATVLTFLAVYGFNAKSHLEGSSFAQLGEQQFDAAITILADPDDPRRIGLPFDAEGSPRQRFALVHAGVTTALAHDRRTARRARTTTTGNAIPGGAAVGPVPTDVRMPPGETTPTEMIRSVRRGLLVTEFNYVRILDPKTTVATGLTRNGTFLIEDGEVTDPVGNLRFTQSFHDALAEGRVAAVGDDDRYADGELGSG